MDLLDFIQENFNGFQIDGHSDYARIAERLKALGYKPTNSTVWLIINTLKADKDLVELKFS